MIWLATCQEISNWVLWILFTFMYKFLCGQIFFIFCFKANGNLIYWCSNIKYFWRTASWFSEVVTVFSIHNKNVWGFPYFHIPNNAYNYFYFFLFLFFCDNLPSECDIISDFDFNLHFLRRKGVKYLLIYIYIVIKWMKFYHSHQMGAIEGYDVGWNKLNTKTNTVYSSLYVGNKILKSQNTKC